MSSRLPISCRGSKQIYVTTARVSTVFPTHKPSSNSENTHKITSRGRCPAHSEFDTITLLFLLVLSFRDEDLDVLFQSVEDELLRHLFYHGFRAHVGADYAHSWIRLVLLSKTADKFGHTRKQLHFIPVAGGLLNVVRVDVTQARYHSSCPPTPEIGTEYAHHVVRGEYTL